MEIINPDGIGGNPFGDIQPMGCGTSPPPPPFVFGGGGGDVPPECAAVVICYVDCPIF